MEGWRQWRLGGRKTLSNKKQRTLDSDRPSHGRRVHSLDHDMVVSPRPLIVPTKTKAPEEFRRNIQ
jgi:hypothetical protein